MARGTTLILVGQIAIFVFSFLSGMAGQAGGGAARAFVGLLLFCVGLVNVAGAWLLTSPDPSGIGEDRYGAIRRFIRVTLIIGLAESILSTGGSLLPLSPNLMMVLLVVAGLAGLTGVAGQVAQLSYLERLAMRIPDLAASKRAHFLKYGIGISSALLIIAGIGGTIIVLSGSGRGAMGMIGTGAAVAGIAALALLVFGVMYLFLLGNLGKRFREQARLARTTWAATPIRSPENSSS